MDITVLRDSGKKIPGRKPDDFGSPTFSDKSEAATHYVPLKIDDRFHAKFNLNGQKPNAMTMCKLYLPDEMVEDFAGSTNSYAKQRLTVQVEITKTTSTGKSSSTRQKFTKAKTVRSWHLLHFFAIIFYFGVVRLPAKADYWSTHHRMPTMKFATKWI